MSWTVERARVASLPRSRPDDDPDLVAARRNLRAERLALHVKRVLAQAPPLTDEQVERIAALLRAGTPPDLPAAGAQHRPARKTLPRRQHREGGAA